MSSMPRGRKITISCEVGHAYALVLRRRLAAAVAHVKRAPTILGVAVVSATTMRRLHRQFLSKSTATDVLSFEISRGARGGITEAEIVICLDVARQQAQLRGHAVENELLLYALHGLLHLCGYDDTTPSEAARMHAREDYILESIGIGPIFAPSRPGRPTLRTGKSVAGRRASS